MGKIGAADLDAEGIILGDGLGELDGVDHSVRFARYLFRQYFVDPRAS